MKDDRTPRPSCSTVSGGAIALRRPTTALPQARPRPSVRRSTPYVVRIGALRSRSVIASISAWARRISSSGTVVRMAASTRPRSDSVNGP